MAHRPMTRHVAPHDVAIHHDPHPHDVAIHDGAMDRHVAIDDGAMDRDVSLSPAEASPAALWAVYESLGGATFVRRRQAPPQRSVFSTCHVERNDHRASW